MARLRMRLIRFGDRDGLGTSEATRTRGGPSVRGSRSAHRHDLAGREIVGIRNWVLGDQEGIGYRQSYRLVGARSASGDGSGAANRRLVMTINGLAHH